MPVPMQQSPITGANVAKRGPALRAGVDRVLADNPTLMRLRELEVLETCTVALLATRRQRGAAGLGGHDGLPGHDSLFIDGAWVEWTGAATQLSPGDRVRVATPGGGGWSRAAER